VFIEAKDDGSGVDNWSYKTCKLQSPIFLLARCPSCRPTNSVKALKGKYHIPWTCLPPAQLVVFQLCLWPLIAPSYLGEGCHASHQPSDASTPDGFRRLELWKLLFH